MDAARFAELSTPFTGEEMPDPDQLAEQVAFLTQNVARVVPLEMLVRQEPLATDLQLERAGQLSAALQTETERLRGELEVVLAREGGRWTVRSRMDNCDAADRGDIEELAHYMPIFNTKHIWWDDVAAAIVKGWPVEIELNRFTAQSWYSQHGNLPRRCNSELGAVIRNIMAIVPNLRLIASIDDVPLNPRCPGVSERIVRGVASTLIQAGVILPRDTPGNQFAVVRRQTQLGKVEQLAQLLTDAQQGKVVRNADGGLSYQTRGTSDQRPYSLTYNHHGVIVPGTDFADAASFLNSAEGSINRQLVHVSTGTFRKDVVARLLQDAGLVGTEQYHWIRQSDSVDEGTVITNTYIFCKLLQRHIDEYARSLTRYNAWSQMDPYAYVLMHFAEVHDEDHEIIREVIDAFRQFGLRPNSIETALDVGPGPNPYSAMLIAPFVKGQITLREYSSSNREFLEKLIAGDIDPRYGAATWQQFEDLMVEFGGEYYDGSYKRTLGKVAVEPGSIYDLEPESQDWITAFFVLESIVATKLPFWQLMKIVAQALRKPDPNNSEDRGGIFMGAFMIGSEGWPAGEGTSFPAVKVDLPEVEAAATEAGLEYDLIPIGLSENTKRVREGYKGMALMIAWRRVSTTPVPTGVI